MVQLVLATTTFLILLLAFLPRLWSYDPTKIRLSRKIFKKMIVLLMAGGAFAGLLLLAEALRYSVGALPRSMILAAVLAIITMLLAVLFSPKVKRRLTVFLHKNFYQNKYDYRTQWLQFTEYLSSCRSREDLLVSILTAYCQTFGMRCGALFLREHCEYLPAASLEMQLAQAAVPDDDAALCFMAERRWVLDLREPLPVKAGEELAKVFARHSIVLAIPLFLKGSLDGFILLGKPVAKGEAYDFEDYDLMKTFARQGAAAILNFRLSEQLAQAREMEIMGKVSSFVIHDLKNLVYTMSLVVDNAREFVADPEFLDDMLASLDNSVTRMKELIGKLKSYPGQHLIKKDTVDLLELVTTCTSPISAHSLVVCGGNVRTVVDSEEIQKVVVNLVMNALDATDGKGPVKVEVGGGDPAFIRVSDGGCGMTADFLRRDLFIPFKTTKKKGLGIGLYQCKQIVEAHGGKIEVMSEPGRGAEFTVWLPKGVERRGADVQLPVLEG